MNGKTIQYNQLSDIIEHISMVLDSQCVEVPQENSVTDKPLTFSNEVQILLGNAVLSMKMSLAYAKRVDGLLSGDEDESTFMTRLTDEFELLITQIPNKS